MGVITPITSWSGQPKGVIMVKGVITSMITGVICDHAMIMLLFFLGNGWAIPPYPNILDEFILLFHPVQNWQNFIIFLSHELLLRGSDDFSGIFGLPDSLWHLSQRLNLGKPTLTRFGLTDSSLGRNVLHSSYRVVIVEGCVRVNPHAPFLRELPWGWRLKLCSSCWKQYWKRAMLFRIPHLLGAT